MSDRYLRFERVGMSDGDRAETERVREYAEQLRRHLRTREMDIANAHVHNAGSSVIQKLIGERLVPLGFQEEHRVAGVGTYSGGARADFYGSLGPGRGIIVEVERGGTITNNHDLKDFWKTHIAEDAHHLFLVVPMANWSEAGRVRERPFGRMHPRFVSFFSGGPREVDVLSLHVFGYGPEHPPGLEPN